MDDVDTESDAVEAVEMEELPDGRWIVAVPRKESFIRSVMFAALATIVTLALVFFAICAGVCYVGWLVIRSIFGRN